MKRKAIAILGSPHKNGTCGKMLDVACEAAKECDYVVEWIDLYALKGAYCKGCMVCRETDQCVIQDDMSILGEKMKQCDLVILAAPTYFANVPAVVKNMFDRLSGVTMKTSKMGTPIGKMKKTQKYLLCTSCDTPAPFNRICGQSSGTMRAMHEFFKTSGMTCVGMIIAPGRSGEKELSDRLRKKIERKVK